MTQTMCLLSIYLATIAQVLAASSVRIQAVLPGLFTSNGDGKGPPSGWLLRARSDGTRSLEPLAVYDPGHNSYTTATIDFGPANDELFLMLYGTGVRYARRVNVAAGGIAMDVLYAGGTSEDQIANAVQLSFD